MGSGDFGNVVVSLMVGFFFFFALLCCLVTPGDC